MADSNPGDQLLCCENVAYDAESGVAGRTCRALLDPTLVGDQRVLTNLLESESRYMPSCSYFQCVQGEVKLPMRRILAYWMAEVCEEQQCQDDVFPLAMNLLDRFLSVANVRKQHLQLLGAVCLFISSKLRESRSLPAELLVQCTDNSCSASDVLEWEVLVLHKLRWEVSSITAYDFLTPLLHRLPLDEYLPEAKVPEVRRMAQTYIVMCATEYKFALYTPSMIASAALVAALSVFVPRQRKTEAADRILGTLLTLTCIELDLLRGCWKQIEELIVELGSDSGGRKRSGSNSTGKGSADTPTDVLDVDF